MRLSWVKDDRPVWDADKQRVVGGAPPGSLELHHEPGADLPGDWWAARDPEGKAVGFGWLDSTWGGDAEVLLAVDASSQRQGVGAFILEHIEREAARQGINYVYNTVRSTHPDRESVHDWLAARGYKGGTSDTALRKRVRDEDQAPAPARPSAGADATPLSARPPGHEETGGYVNVEDHQY